MNSFSIYNFEKTTEPGARQPVGLFEPEGGGQSSTEKVFEKTLETERQAYDAPRETQPIFAEKQTASTGLSNKSSFRNNPSAHIDADNTESKASKAKRLEADHQTHSVKNQTSKIDDWHHFLEQAREKEKQIGQQAIREKGGLKSIVTKETTVVYEQLEVGHLKQFKLTKADGKKLLAHLNTLGIALSEKEQSSLLKGNLTIDLLKKIEKELTLLTSQGQVDKAHVQVIELLKKARQTEPTESTTPILPKLPNELKEALQALLQDDSTELEAWLGDQDLPEALQASIKDFLAEYLKQRESLNLSKADQTTADELLITFLVEFLATEKIEADKLEQPLSGRGTLNLDTIQSQGLDGVGGKQASVGNQVLQAFKIQVQAFKQKITELVQSSEQLVEPKEQLSRGFESLVTSHLIGRESAKVDVNIHHHSQTITQTQASLSSQQQPGAAFKLEQTEKMEQGLERFQQSAFEQARQTQQYIDLFTPKAPQQLRDQVALMYHKKEQFAQLRLDPPELGRLNVRLQVNSEQQASVVFVVASPQAREAVEQAMPRLREMLEEQGIQLADADVREDSSAASHTNQEEQGAAGQHATGHSTDEILNAETQPQVENYYIKAPTGQIDYYV